MRVADLQRESMLKDAQIVRLCNPDIKDFTVNYSGKPYTVPANDIAAFPLKIAEHVKKHLARYLLNKRGVKNTPEADLKEIYKEIEVNLWT